VKYISLYACDKCGQEFREQEICKAHENSHIEPSSYTLAIESQYTPDSKYPDAISIEMEDGARVLYSLFAVSSEQENSPSVIGSSAKD
jgi:hypothetical protein